MEEIRNPNNLYIENDKRNAPFLLAASFQGLIVFQGDYSQNGVLYWQFSPKSKAEELISQFKTKTNPPIPARDLFEAIDAFWEQVSHVKGGKRP